MNLLSIFKQYIKAKNLFQPKAHLLLAVSGGVDSVVLCELCKQADYEFAIAHCNFQLRGAESNGDEAFVKELAANYNVPFFVKQFETEKYAAENKISIQVAARKLRYKWFAELINQSTNQPINYLLTAHHSDDNMETILMNFFKGSGINGLKGILPKQKNIVRPLLSVSKEKILAFAAEKNLTYREDSSNSSDKYTRNYFRNQLIPALEKVFPQVKENLLQNAERFKDINILYQSAIDNATKKMVKMQGKEMHIPVLKLDKTPARHTVLYELIKPFNFTAHQTGDVEKLLQSESGKYVNSSTHMALRNRKWLIISPLNLTEAEHILIEENDPEILFEGGKLLLEQKEAAGKIDKDPYVVQLDATHIRFPLLLRKWKKGDYFYPLGMQKKKKLSRFFVDQKLSMLQKQEVWIIESDKKIIWIAGIRIDDRFKITAATKKVLKFTLVK